MPAALLPVVAPAPMPAPAAMGPPAMMRVRAGVCAGVGAGKVEDVGKEPRSWEEGGGRGGFYTRGGMGSGCDGPRLRPCGHVATKCSQIPDLPPRHLLHLPILADGARPLPGSTPTRSSLTRPDPRLRPRRRPSALVVAHPSSSPRLSRPRRPISQSVIDHPRCARLMIATVRTQILTYAPQSAGAIPGHRSSNHTPDRA